jgi:hypothetical protein
MGATYQKARLSRENIPFSTLEKNKAWHRFLEGQAFGIPFHLFPPWDTLRKVHSGSTKKGG